MIDAKLRRTYFMGFYLYFFIGLCLFISSCVTPVKNISNLREIPSNEGIVTGRVFYIHENKEKIWPDFWAGSCDLVVYEKNSKKEYRICVKKKMTEKSKRDGRFLVSLPPGEYIISHFEWDITAYHYVKIYFSGTHFNKLPPLFIDITYDFEVKENHLTYLGDFSIDFGNISPFRPAPWFFEVGVNVKNTWDTTKELLVQYFGDEILKYPVILPAYLKFPEYLKYLRYLKDLKHLNPMNY